MNPLGRSRSASVHSFNSRPAKHGNKVFWGVAVLYMLGLGASASAQVTLIPATLSFGNQAVDFASVPKTATLKNAQTVPLTINAIAISGGTAPADYAWGGNCPISPKTLGAGLTCSITVTFKPSALGSRTASLIVTHSASNSPQSLALTGSGVLPVTLAPSTLGFGSQAEKTTSAAKTVIVKNMQTVPLTISAIAISGGTAPADYAWGGNCPISPNTLSAKLSCNITVTFTPSALGSRTASLIVTHSASNSPQSVALTGTGVTPVTVSPATLTFASRLVETTSPAKIVTLTNHLGTALSLSSITASGDFALANTTSCGSYVGAGQQCIIAVTFTPTVVGLRHGTLTINSPTFSSPIQVKVTGTGNNIPQSAIFVLTGSMKTARSEHTATQLNNGMVLIVGGSNSPSAELYDPATGSFTPTGNLNTARSGHTATPLANGMVLIAGGGDSDGNILASAELYNPATGTFTLTKGTMNAARYLHTATLLSNGSVLITGGSGDSGTLGSAEYYYPTYGYFYQTGTLHYARERHTATLLNNGMVLIAGGAGASGVATAELYNPATGYFALTGTLNAWREFASATLLNNGMVLIAGGDQIFFDTNLASAELYNPTSGTFSYTGSMGTAREYHTATLLNNGMVLVAGGESATSFLASAELYDPAAGTFAATGSMNAVRESQTATLLNNGMMLITGGYDNSSNLASAELYIPSTLAPPNLVSITVTPATFALSPGQTQPFVATGTFSDTSTEQLASVTWNSSDTTVAEVANDASSPTLGYAVALGTTTISATAGSVSGSATLAVRPPGFFVGIASLNTARSSHTATLLTNGTVLIAGGYNSSGYLSSAEIYNPATMTFTPTGSLNTARTNHTATLLYNGMVLLAGGNNSSGYLASAELYNPATGAFTPTGSMTSTRVEHTATALGSTVLIAGGVSGNGYLASAEVYNSATGGFTPTGSMTTARPTTQQPLLLGTDHTC